MVLAEYCLLAGNRHSFRLPLLWPERSYAYYQPEDGYYTSANESEDSYERKFECKLTGCTINLLVKITPNGLMSVINESRSPYMIIKNLSAQFVINRSMKIKINLSNEPLNRYCKYFLRDVNVNFLSDMHFDLCFGFDLTQFKKMRDLPALKVKKQSFLEELNPTLYKEFYGKDFLTDFTIICQRTKFRVHKVILAKRSPYFRRMFSHQMKETIQSKIRIHVDVEVMRILLRYIYVGQIIFRETNKFLLHTFVLADMYELDDLLSVCELFFMRNINILNACETVVFINMFNRRFLRRRMINFCRNSLKTIMKSKGFELLCRPKNVDLLSEIMDTQVSPLNQLAIEPKKKETHLNAELTEENEQEFRSLGA